MAIEFVPVLLGSDINAYSMARAFHEAYGVKTIVYGMFPASVCAGSRIIDYRVREHNDRVDKVLENVTEVAREFPNRKILVLGCGDNYLNAISANLPRYPENVIAPVPRGNHCLKCLSCGGGTAVSEPGTYRRGEEGGAGVSGYFRKRKFLSGNAGSRDPGAAACKPETDPAF